MDRVLEVREAVEASQELLDYQHSPALADQL